MYFSYLMTWQNHRNDVPAKDFLPPHRQVAESSCNDHLICCDVLEHKKQYSVPDTKERKKGKKNDHLSMPSISDMKKLSAASGLGFGVFLIMHLSTHYTLTFGWDLALSTQLALRNVYFNPAVEVMTYASLLVHMYANTTLYLARQKATSSSTKKKEGKTDNVSTELKFHRYTGYFLGLFVLPHAFAVRLGPLLIMEDASVYDYAFVIKANQIFPAIAFSGYLLALGIAGTWHLIYGTRSALAILQGRSVFGIKFPIPLKVLAMLGHILIFSAVLALNGFYYSIDISEKDEVATKYFDAMGM